MTLAGAWAGFVQAPARQVIERVKSVMQVRERSSTTSSSSSTSGGRSSKAPYSWSGQCAYQLVKEEGLAMGYVLKIVLFLVAQVWNLHCNCVLGIR
jgi:hypothetical protein